MTIECIRFNEYKKGALLGFADIYVPKWGVEIKGFTLFAKDGKRWVNFPGQEFEKDGEKKFSPVFRFREKEVYDAFMKAVKTAIEKEIPAENTFDPNDVPF